MLLKFDAWLLEKIEKLAQWWQKIFGQDNFWWSKLFSIIYTCCLTAYAVGAVWYAYPIKNWWFYFYMLFPSTIPNICGWYNWFNIYKENVYKNLENGIANALKLKLVEMRLLYFLVPLMLSIPPLLIKLARHALIPFLLESLPPISGLSLLLVIYCVSCDPLPPAKSKVKIWFEKLVAKTKEFFSPEPAPIPVPITT